MLRLASDADVNGHIIRSLRRREPGIDLERVQDHLPEGTPDPDVLAWAAKEGRILITRDRNTMIRFARERLGRGEPLPGVIALTRRLSVADAIDGILTVADCMTAEEVRDQAIIFLPL